MRATQIGLFVSVVQTTISMARGRFVDSIAYRRLFMRMPSKQSVGALINDIREGVLGA